MPKKKNSIAEYIDALKASDRIRDQVVCHKLLPESRAIYGKPEKPWSGPVSQILKQAGIKKLFKHQSLAIDMIRSGKNVIAATPTASGKTLIYNLPILEALTDDKNAHALYLFPLKALTQDQLKTFGNLSKALKKNPVAAIYDGDTSTWHRRKLRENPPNAIFTNPDMLHLAFLPYHHNWASFFSGLKYVVVDELHTYRGVMGSHMAWVFARLLRICRYYGANPAFIMCSATIANPGELASQLTGLDFKLIEKSTAPKGARHVVFINPMAGPAQTAILLLKAALARGLRTIIYTQSRKMAELIALWASGRAGKFSGKISSYRAGYLPEERRDIEKKLASGELLAVVSTSALELGIDIGNLDLCILAGYPGTVMATWQRAGRVGRDLADSAMILIAGEDALDQYFMRHPEDFFSRPVESAVINPNNSVICAKHLECAAAELPIMADESLIASPEISAQINKLEAQGRLLRGANGDKLYAAKKMPHRDVDLRGAGSQFIITVADFNDPDAISGKSVGQMDLMRVFKEAHPGAIYLHLGKTYRVSELDLEKRTVFARPMHVDYYTRARSDKDTEILEIYGEKTIWGTRVYSGKLRVTDHVTGYEKKKTRTGKSLGITPLELPPNTFETQGIWFDIPDYSRRATESEYMHFMGGIHAIEHAAIGILPLIVMADRNDLGGISTPFHPQIGGACVFIYDAVPGGVGLCLMAFQKAKELLTRTSQAISSCPCKTGCPSCVHSPKCGSGNRPIDKAASIFILNSIKKSKPGKKQAPQKPILPVEEKSKPETPSQEKSRTKEKTMEAKKTRARPEKPQKKSGSEKKLRYGVLDIETRRSAADVGGWNKAYRMGVSCSVLYDSGKDEYFDYFQDDIDELAKHLQKFDVVVGFNIKKFDYQVLMAHTGFDFSLIPTLDMLDEIYPTLGYRVSLDKLAQATLGAKKTADGLIALEWWKQGKMDKILKYCRDDVRITRDLYLYGKKHGHLLFINKAQKKVCVQVKW